MTDAEKKVLDEEVVVESVDVEVGTMEDVDAIMKKYDRESNTRVWEGTPKKILRYVLAAFMLFMVYMNLWATWSGQIRRCLFVGFVILFTFFIYPVKKGNVKPNSMPWYDILLAVAGCIPYFYYVANFKRIVAMGIAIGQTEVILGIIGTLVLAECCRRAVGLPILVVAGCFVLYAFIGRGMSLDLVVYNIFYTTNGIIGTPISVCSTYIALFLLFGAFLEATGVANFFIDCANALVGWASGGPAKVAVVSSALCGMVSGSSVGNTVTTGSVTIPMMKKTGYPPEFAGAVEAASSTGGQIMPPIMGAAAFIMAEMTDFEYSEIIVRAILPAFLYFLGIFLGVHFKAKKLGLKGLPREELPKWKILLPQIYLILPLVVLVYMIMIGFTMATAAVYATLYCVVVAMISREEGKKKLVMAIPLIPLLFMTLMSRSFEPGTFMGENGSTLCLAIDLTIIVFYAAVFRSLENALYGGIALYISTKVMDMVVYGGSAAKLAYIISNEQEKITHELLARDMGVTRLTAEGAYTHNDKPVLLCAVRRREIVAVKRLVNEIDPTAFFIVCDAREVLGEGFGEYKPDGL